MNDVYAGRPNLGGFWGEIAPCEHMVQIYANDDVFLDSLEGFVHGGLVAGDGVVVIATQIHIGSLEARLVRRGLDVASAQAAEQFIALDAQETLDKFIVSGWPDEGLFRKFVLKTLESAGRGGRRVRAFGEMVAVLWGNGNSGATVRLEHLWKRLCEDEKLSLFCAYPKSGFTRDAQLSLQEIFDLHSRVMS